jgi:hypothetical protein
MPADLRAALIHFCINSLRILNGRLEAAISVCSPTGSGREQKFEFPPGSQHPRLDPAPATQALGPGPIPSTVSSSPSSSLISKRSLKALDLSTHVNASSARVKVKAPSLGVGADAAYSAQSERRFHAIVNAR